MATVNVTRVASALNLTERRVQQFVKEGLPREAGGKYDPVKCMFFYIRYLQNAIEKKSLPALDGDYAGEREARVRLLSADADLREIELAKQLSQLVTIDDANRAVADLVAVTTALVMEIPSRVAPSLVGEISRVMIQAKIEKAVKATLASLARVMNDGHGPDQS